MSQEETCTLKYKKDFHQNSSLEYILLDIDREDKTPGINREQETPTYDTSFEDHLPEEEDFQEEEDHCMEENLPGNSRRQSVSFVLYFDPVYTDCENCGNMAYAYCADCTNNHCQALGTECLKDETTRSLDWICWQQLKDALVLLKKNQLTSMVSGRLLYKCKLKPKSYLWYNHKSLNGS